MNEPQTLTMEILRQQMQQVERDMQGMQQKMDKMLNALMGSDLLQDGGLIGKMKIMEKQMDEMELRILAAEKRSDKLEVYQKILWGCGGGFAQTTTLSPSTFAIDFGSTVTLTVTIELANAADAGNLDFIRTVAYK